MNEFEEDKLTMEDIIARGRLLGEAIGLILKPMLDALTPILPYLEMLNPDLDYGEKDRLHETSEMKGPREANLGMKVSEVDSKPQTRGKEPLKVSISLESETDKAYLIMDSDGRKAWIPKKAVNDINIDPDNFGSITIAHWFKDKLSWTKGGN